MCSLNGRLMWCFRNTDAKIGTNSHTIINYAYLISHNPYIGGLNLEYGLTWMVNHLTFTSICTCSNQYIIYLFLSFLSWYIQLSHLTPRQLLSDVCSFTWVPLCLFIGPRITQNKTYYSRPNENPNLWSSRPSAILLNHQSVHIHHELPAGCCCLREETCDLKWLIVYSLFLRSLISYLLKKWSAQRVINTHNKVDWN